MTKSGTLKLAIMLILAIATLTGCIHPDGGRYHDRDHHDRNRDHDRDYRRDQHNRYDDHDHR